jgi:hypothetical protein
MTHRAWRAVATVSGALALGAIATAACGRANPAQPVTAGAPVASVAPAVAAGPALPTLPPVEQRAPELFDDQGCARTGPQTASCSSTAADIDRADAAPGAGQRLAGFVGGSWSAAPPSGAIVVLESSVTATTTADGHWSALGLVRNQRADVVGGAAVHAQLIGADGSVLETVTADALVPALRSGEPAPFSLATTTTMAAQVASVRWSADAGAPAAASAPPVPDPASRSLELQTYWTRRPSESRRIDNYLFHDPTTGPAPLVVFGSVTDVAPAPIAQPHVVAAWLDANGRVSIVRDVAVSASTGQAASTVAPSGADDFLVAVAPSEVPPVADLAAPMLWGFGA